MQADTGHKGKDGDDGIDDDDDEEDEDDDDGEANANKGGSRLFFEGNPFPMTQVKNWGA